MSYFEQTLIAFDDAGVKTPVSPTDPLPVDIKASVPIEIDDSTPVDVNIASPDPLPVTDAALAGTLDVDIVASIPLPIDDSTPIEVDIASSIPLPIDDSTPIDVNISSPDPLPTSLEALDSTLSDNGNTQQKVTTYHSDGTEGVLLSGLNYVSGKSGIDASTESLQTISYEHHEVHSGSAYFYKEAHAIAKNGTVDHLIITPNTTAWAHMVLHVEGLSSSVTVEFYEDTTTSADGTLEDSFNRNRNVADDNTTEVYEGPTVTAVGTELMSWDLGAGRKSDGGMKRDAIEVVLKQNSKYLLRVTEDNIEATMVNIGFDWYEHTNKN